MFEMYYGFEIICASVFTVFCIISARIYSVLNKAYTYWDKRKIHGPVPRYLIGTWSGFAEKFLGNVDHANVLKFGRTYGTYDGLLPNLLVTDPELIKQIISASTDNFQDVRFASENSVVLKDSLLCLCGGWKPEIQILTGSLLGLPKLEKLLPKVESSVEILLNNITRERKDDGLVNITLPVADFINEATAHIIFGIELNADVEFKTEFVRNREKIFNVKAPKSIWSLLPYLYENYFKDAWIFPEKSLQYFVNLIISGISESSTEANLTQGKGSNLIELMVEAADEEKKLVNKDKENQSSEVILTDNTIISKCIATTLSLASMTQTTVLMAIQALANNEEVQEKLYAEIEKNKSETISYESILNLNYLDKVVKEVLRLYPFEFRLEKFTTDAVKLGEIELNKGIRVSVPLYGLHRLEEYYPEPEKFNPERFSRSELEKRNAYLYLPFGQAGFNGSDISLRIAVLTAKLTLLRLIEKFKFSALQQQSLYKLFEEGFTRIPKPRKIEVFAETRL